MQVAVEQLQRNYGERPVLRLIDDNGSMSLLFVDRAGVSWTAFEVRPNGLLCQINNGSFWELIEREPET